jgi:hypothetical protein
LTRLIDAAIDRELASNGIKASPQADDAEFLRRVYLDLTGAIPPSDRAAEFLDSTDPDKRTRLIDELLENPAYGWHMADIWQTLLLPKSSDNRRVPTEPFANWLAEAFNANKPWNETVRELLTASGPTDENAAATFFIANNTPDKVNDDVCRLFLGVQLQCAQCHNHPFAPWKQEEYWGMAAFFMNVRVNGKPNQAAKNGATLEVTENAGAKGKRPPLPESAKRVPPKFFQGERPRLSPAEPLRPVVAQWLTDPHNPFFARAMVNRVWAQLFGRGFVVPVDDVHEGNPASHPELFQQLAGQFAASAFDLKHLFRAACNSRAYQRTSRPADGNEDDETYFSHMAIKAMTPEQLYDSLVAVLGRGKGAEAATPRNQKGPPGAGPRGNFLNFFGLDQGSNPLEFQEGVPQVLRLMNSGQFNPANSPWLNQLVITTTAKDQVAERLCLAALSRRPIPSESEKWTEYLAREKDPRMAAGDLLWALLNSSEFTLNH